MMASEQQSTPPRGGADGVPGRHRQLVDRAKMTDDGPIRDTYSVVRQQSCRDQPLYRMTLMAEAVRDAGEPQDVSVVWFPDEDALVIDLDGGAPDG